jgi:hypothetical protein
MNSPKGQNKISPLATLPISVIFLIGLIQLIPVISEFMQGSFIESTENTCSSIISGENNKVQNKCGDVTNK